MSWTARRVQLATLAAQIILFGVVRILGDTHAFETPAGRDDGMTIAESWVTMSHDDAVVYALSGAIGAALLFRQAVAQIWRRRSPHVPLRSGGMPWAARMSRLLTLHRPMRTQPPRIVFDTQEPASVSSTSPAAAADLRDGVTGQVIDATSSLFRCGNCDVLYQPASFDLLRQANDGRCAACGSTAIASISQHSPTTERGWRQETAIATLANYRWLEGQVVVFEGLCINVYPSRSGSSYAVMFEEAPWTRGFKLVILRAAVPRIGVAFIQDLIGKRIRVCGPIVRDPIFGYEIVLKDRSTILGVWS